LSTNVGSVAPAVSHPVSHIVLKLFPASLSRADLVRVGGWCWQPRDRRPSSAKRYRFVVRPSSTFRASDIVATPVATARNSSGSKPLIVTGRLCWPT